MKNRKNFFQKVVTLVFIVALISASQNALAQDRLSFEFRPGVNLPTQDLGDANLKTGFGFEGTFAYQFMPHLSVYAGWGWNKFGSDQEVGGTSLDFEETGYTYGLQFIHPIGESKIDLLIRGGGLANHIEVEQGDEIIADSGHGFGWQLEAGVAIPLAEKWRLVPSVRYRSLSRDIEIETVTTSADLNYISAGVGISRTF